MTLVHYEQKKFNIQRVFIPLVDSAYRYLIDAFDNDVIVIDHSNFSHILWLKTILLKVSLFAWCLLLNRLSTRDNLEIIY